MAVWLSASPSVAQPADSTLAGHYAVYTSDGHPTTLDAVVAALRGVDVVFLGETHDDPVAHYLERIVLERAFGRFAADTTNVRPVAISFEQFSRDVQYIMDEYLGGLITEKHFRGSTNPWQNYETDYRPMVEFARVHHVPVIAANAPRRYANRVTRHGPESLADLSDQAKTFLAPLPYAQASAPYKEQWDTAMAESMEEMRAAMAKSKDSTASAPDSVGAAVDEPATHTVTLHDTSTTHAADSTHQDDQSFMHKGTLHMLEAQSLWDATMAYSIADYLLRHPGTLVVHVVGGFHVEHGTGIPEHLERYRPGTRRLIVSLHPAQDISAFDPTEMEGLGDFVILTDESLPRSYDAE